MNKPVNISLLAMIMVLLTACISAKDKAFAYLIPIGDMNSSIKLAMWEPEKNDNLRIGDSISLSLTNVSYYDISFTTYEGVYILSYDETSSEWQEISNSVNYSNKIENLTLIEAGSESAKIQVYPRINNNNQPVQIRVVIVGSTAANPFL
jgi:hypothetical protein